MEEQNYSFNWVNSLSTISGLVAALCLVSSLIYDWAFFRAANLSFLEIPSTISDHVRSSLIWLPTVLGTLIFLTINELYLKRVEHGMTEEEIIASSKDPEKIRKFRDSPKKLIIAIATLAFVTYILIGDIDLTPVIVPVCD